MFLTSKVLTAFLELPLWGREKWVLRCRVESRRCLRHGQLLRNRGVVVGTECELCGGWRIGVRDRAEGRGVPMAATLDFIAPNCAKRVHTFPWDKEPLQVRSGAPKEITMLRALHEGVLCGQLHTVVYGLAGLHSNL